MGKAAKSDIKPSKNDRKVKKKGPGRSSKKEPSAGELKLRSLLDSATKISEKPKKEHAPVGSVPAPAVDKVEARESTRNRDALKETPRKEKAKPGLNKRRSKDKATTYTDSPNVVFIGNVPLAMDKNELIKKMKIDPKIVKSVHFRSLPVEAKFSTNKRVGIIRGRLTDAKSSKNAYMTLIDDKHVDEVLQKNTMEVDGHYLFVNKASPSSFSKFSRKKTVFVGRLPPSTTENELFDVFSNVGLVKDIRIIRDPKTFESKGFGFVAFDTRNAVPEAIEAFNNKEFKGYTLHVMKALDQEAASEKKAKSVKGNKTKKPGKVKKPLSKNKSSRRK